MPLIQIKSKIVHKAVVTEKRNATSYSFKTYIPNSTLSPYLIENRFLSCKELLVAHLAREGFWRWAVQELMSHSKKGWERNGLWLMTLSTGV